MEYKSVFDDLKKYSGTSWVTNAQKICSEKMPVNNDQISDQFSDQVSDQVNFGKNNEKDNSGEIMAKLAKFNIVQENGKISLDNSTVLIKCEQGHVHRYNVNDIIKGKQTTEAGNIKCITCTFKLKYIMQCRLEAEKLYARPFTVMSTTTRGRVNTVELDGGDIHIECNKIICGKEDPISYDNFKLYVVPYTTSPKKINKYIGGNDTKLVEKPSQVNNLGQSIAVSADEKISDKKKTTKVKKERKPRAKFVKDPIPYTLAAAHNMALDLGGTITDYNIKQLGRLL